MLTAFTASLLLITISELGDKTFFIAVILACRHSPRLVFTGVTGALVLMTGISVLVGQAVSRLPQVYVDWAEIILFAIFGIQLLYSASKMSNQPCQEEEEEALEVVNKAESELGKGKETWAIVLQAFTLTFMAEWGDRTQFATIALAASYTPWGVILGGSLGHALCAAIAVKGGHYITRYLSERILTAIGGGLFILFSLVALWENFLVPA